MMNRVTIVLALLGVLVVGTSAPAGAQKATISGVPVTGAFPPPSKEADPLDHLPPNTRLISEFGERAVFSPDGSKLAFVEYAYGDVFEYDLKTRTVRNLTAHTPNSGFLRVHYMKDGSYLLLAPRRMSGSKEETRAAHIELWWMDAKSEGPLIALKQTVFEGIAVSPTSSRVAWGILSPRIGTRPAGIGGEVTLMTAEVRVNEGSAILADIRPIVSRKWDECTLEPQDFYDEDRKLTATCYVMNRSRMPGAKPVAQAQVYSVDVASGSMTRFPTPLELFAEAEGVFSSGKHTTVECGNDQAKGVDICILEMKADNPRYMRVTFAQDYGAYRFSNSQVSRDGRHMAFQIGLAAEEAGSGRGILLMDLPGGL